MIKASEILELQTVVTGMHLSESFVFTKNEILSDGFTINAEVPSLTDDDTALGVTVSVGQGVIGFADVFNRISPDLVLLLGDRFEILSAAIAAYIARIPIAHVHGGELTEGSLDDGFRHAITKLSSLHFVAAEEYRLRVVQLGEHPDRVFLVGGLGADLISHTKFLDRSQVEDSLNFRLLDTTVLVTYHPIAGDQQASTDELSEILAALHQLVDTSIIFTLSNADSSGRILNDMILKFVDSHSNARAFHSLGHQRYLSLLKLVDVVVGNSSSGLLEAPSLGTPTVNIGHRQLGRLRAKSVIDSTADRTTILLEIRKILEQHRVNTARTYTSPYEGSDTIAKILTILECTDLQPLTNKRFYDFSDLELNNI